MLHLNSRPLGGAGAPRFPAPLSKDQPRRFALIPNLPHVTRVAVVLWAAQAASLRAAPAPAAPAAAAPAAAPAAPAPAAPSPAPAAPNPAVPAPAAVGGFGQPIAGATAAELAAFAAGSADFNTLETPATGLGPIFNDVSCLVCHSAPAAGGTSRSHVTRFGRTSGGVFDPLTALDGTLLHARAIAPVLQEVLPAEANVVAQRIPTPLFGAGLIEAIPDATIIANAQLPKPAGVGGRVAIVTDVATGASRVGRFGWKAQHATLLSFSGDALNNEIGITNRLFPKAAAPDGNEALLAQFVSPTAPIEDQPSSATGLSEIDRLSAYLRLLAPPREATASAAAAAGRQLFGTVGCAACHTPTMTTGPNVSAALSNQTVALYSDLLLHDMGSLGDGIAQGDAGPTEMRTSPLWGLSARGPYLHDGRAATVAAAILAHAGQGAASTAAYSQLSAAEQQQLLAFLATL
jgi:CxxC motif-containing protein (DUF1111 family)